LECREIKKLAE
jgi:hypothetical protein